MVLNLNFATDYTLNLLSVGCYRGQHPDVWFPIESPKGLTKEGSSIINK